MFLGRFHWFTIAKFGGNKHQTPQTPLRNFWVWRSVNSFASLSSSILEEFPDCLTFTGKIWGKAKGAQGNAIHSFPSGLFCRHKWLQNNSSHQVSLVRTAYLAKFLKHLPNQHAKHDLPTWCYNFPHNLPLQHQHPMLDLSNPHFQLVELVDQRRVVVGEMRAQSTPMGQQNVLSSMSLTGTLVKPASMY